MKKELKQILKTILYFTILVVIISCEEKDDPEIEIPNEPIPVVYPQLKLQFISGEYQDAPNGTKLPLPIVVKVTDENNNPVDSIKIVFKIIYGGGSLEKKTIMTDQNGKDSVFWKLGHETDHILKVSFSDSKLGRPVYTYAQTNLRLTNMWISGVNLYVYNTEMPHDNRILESNNFLTFSDGSSDDMKIIFSKMAEESFYNIKELFGFESSEDLGVYNDHSYTKITIYTNKNANLPYMQQAFNTGFVLHGLDSPTLQSWNLPKFYFRKQMQHEMTHVLQWLIGLGGVKVNAWPEVWFTEGIAEVASNDLNGSFTSLNDYRQYLETFDFKNPVSIHSNSDYNISMDSIRFYYKLFGLAMHCILSPKGLNKTYEDILALYNDMLTTNNFAKSFKNIMGMSISEFEENYETYVSQYFH